MALATKLADELQALREKLRSMEAASAYALGMPKSKAGGDDIRSWRHAELQATFKARYSSRPPQLRAPRPPSRPPPLPLPIRQLPQLRVPRPPSRPPPLPLPKRQLQSPPPPSPARPQGSAGYVFCCSDEMLSECHRLGLFGSPAVDLAQMRACISAETQLFLFNGDNLTLMGRFTVDGVPELDIEPDAFSSGDFRAQVRISPLDLCLLEVELDDWIEAGPKAADDVEALKDCLKKGKPSQLTVARVARAPTTKRKREELGMKIEKGTETAASLPVKRRLQSRCWDFDRGHCPRGASCRYEHCKDEADRKAEGEDSAAAGYLFACSNSTQQDCFSLKLFGSPDRELNQLKRVIQPGTHLFLHNIENYKLFGPFAALTKPDFNIIPGAFGGKFNAQVHVDSLDGLLLETQMDQRIPGGPKSAREMQMLMEQLEERGTTLDEHLFQFDLAGTVLDDIPAEALRKRPKVEDASTMMDEPPIEAPRKRPKVEDASTMMDEPPTEAPRKRPKVEEPLPKKLPKKYVMPPTTVTAKVEEVSDDEDTKDVAQPVLPAEEQCTVSASNNDVTISHCWDFAKGHCPRGAKCSYPHVKSPAPGYVFLCSDSTLRECGESGLFGSPLKELPQMKQFIADDTTLFLHNFERKVLIGTFASLELPEKDLRQDAFKGKFSAQVTVVPMDQPLLAAAFEKRIASGPKSEAQVEELIARLADGEIAAPDVQQAFGCVV